VSAWTQGRRSRRLLLAASLVVALLNAAFSHPVPRHAQAAGPHKTSSRLERVLPSAADAGNPSELSVIVGAGRTHLGRR